MSQTPFNPTPGVSTHEDCVNVINANATDAENRLSGLESSPPSHTHTVSDITDIDSTYANISHTHSEYAATSHTHTVTDINSSTAPSGYVATSDGAGNTTWEEAQGGSIFSVVTVTTPTYTQIPEHTHHLYDDTGLGGDGSGSGSGGGGACIVVDLLDPTLHEAVTIHKKIGNDCDVLLLPPSGCTIDGVISDGLVSGYNLTSQYESISIFSDGVSGYYIQ